MAWKLAIIVAMALALAIVVAVAAEVVVGEENGWNLETNHKKSAAGKENYVTHSSVFKEQTNGVDSNSLKPNKVSIRMKFLADACSDYACIPGHTECYDNCPKCPGDMDNPDKNVVNCPDKVESGPKAK